MSPGDIAFLAIALIIGIFVLVIIMYVITHSYSHTEREIKSTNPTVEIALELMDSYRQEIAELKAENEKLRQELAVMKTKTWN